MTRERLDRRMRASYPQLSWTRIRTAIERGQVTVAGTIARDPSQEVEDEAEIDFDESRRALKHARLDLDRLHEDEEILVVDKPPGLLTIATHPERRDIEDTVLRRVQAYARRLGGRSAYAGVLHRLDRDTSGALALALTREAHAAGRALFSEHRFDRWYLALVQGRLERARGTITRAIASTYISGRRRLAKESEAARSATTHFVVRERFAHATLVELRLETGRQHQIRLHLESIGHPLIGEKIYDADGMSALGAPRQMLHAWRLAFPHPLRGRRIDVEAPVPPDFEAVLTKLRRRG